MRMRVRFRLSVAIGVSLLVLPFGIFSSIAQETESEVAGNDKVADIIKNYEGRRWAEVKATYKGGAASKEQK